MTKEGGWKPLDFHCIVFKETFWKRHPSRKWRWLWITLDIMLIIKILVWFFGFNFDLHYHKTEMHLNAPPHSETQEEEKILPFQSNSKSNDLLLPLISGILFYYSLLLFFSIALLSCYKQVHFSFIQKQTKSFLWSINVLLLNTCFSVFLFSQASSEIIYHASKCMFIF